MAKKKPKTKRKARRRVPVKRPVKDSPLDKYLLDEEEPQPDRLTLDDLKYLL